MYAKSKNVLNSDKRKAAFHEIKTSPKSLMLSSYTIFSLGLSLLGPTSAAKNLNIVNSTILATGIGGGLSIALFANTLAKKNSTVGQFATAAITTITVASISAYAAFHSSNNFQDRDKPNTIKTVGIVNFAFLLPLTLMSF